MPNTKREKYTTKQCNKTFKKYKFKCTWKYIKNSCVSDPKEKKFWMETKNRFASMHLVAHKVCTLNIQIWDKKTKTTFFENM